MEHNIVERVHSFATSIYIYTSALARLSLIYGRTKELVRNLSYTR